MATKTTPNPTIQNLVQAVLTARTEADVVLLRKTAMELGIQGEQVIGGGDSNAGPIEAASTPHSALIERATNGIDAVLERLARAAGWETLEDWPQAPTGPRDAARILLNLPKAGLDDLTDGERRELAENLVVMLDDSGIKERPTVIVEDRGIGQSVEEMPNGLLSLNRSNKLQKPWRPGRLRDPQVLPVYDFRKPEMPCALAGG
jgi:hypothetical protein